MSETQRDSNAHVDRTLTATVKLYYDLFAPSDAPSPLLVALHGYGSNKGWMMRAARACVPEGFAVAALQGPHQHLKEPREAGAPLRYGFGWLTNFHAADSVAVHHRALLDLIAALVAEGVADRRRLFLLGFSQTCALNYRFAFTHTDILRGVIGICGGIPSDWQTGAYSRAKAAVLHIARRQDEYYPPAVTELYPEKLRMRVEDLEFHMLEGGHRFPSKANVILEGWLGRIVR